MEKLEILQPLSIIISRVICYFGIVGENMQTIRSYGNTEDSM